MVASRWAGLPLLLVFTGCIESVTPTSAYYPIDSLIDVQTRFLLEQKAIVEKTAVMGKQKSTAKFTPSDSNRWAEEMQLFRHLSVINKPVHREDYHVETINDPNSNLTIRRFAAIKPHLPVRYLQIYYLHTPIRLKKLEARYADRNLMFTGVRELTLEFRETGRKSYLSGYSVRGGQKMLLGDSVQYAINGRITLPESKHGEAQKER